METLLRAALSKSISCGQLKVTTASGAEWAIGEGTADKVAIRFADSGAQWALLIDPDLRLGELYMDGRLIIERGTIYDFLYVLLSDSRGKAAPSWARAIDRVRHAARRVRTRNTSGRSKSNVAHHYDLDARLYRLFLDKDMQYSCAYFEHADQDLDVAQLAKKRHIAAKLLIEPGSRVLDIGCGWGGMALYLVEITKAQFVHGITLSVEQHAIAAERSAKLSDPGKVKFEVRDYRETQGTYNRIVSVGMFEHVGPRYYDAFFAKCHRLLDDQGVMLLHTIGCSDVPGFVTPWLDKYIFPGGYIPSLSEILPSIERAGLIVTDIEILQTHYALTLRAWRDRFLQQRSAAKQLYDERFCRMWEFYLSAAEVAFRCEDLVIFQIQLSKSPGTVPMTRDYIKIEEDILKARELSVDRAEAVDGRQNRGGVPFRAGRL